ncbi:hypothetical protein BGZ47_001572 [Haplosporangium gracile]|nr:hypothetical protein BGZ47_001572 [Haplosporangium gracile]
MLQDDVQDHQAVRPIHKESLDPPSIFLLGSTKFIDTHLDLVVPHPMALFASAVSDVDLRGAFTDAKPAAPQENGLETPPESLQELRINTDNSIVDVTNTTQQVPVTGLEETVMDNRSDIDKPVSTKSAHKTQEVQGDNTLGATDAETPTFFQRRQRPTIASGAGIRAHRFQGLYSNEHKCWEARVAFGDMYMDGEGVQQDYQALMKWYLQAANQGYAIGQRRVDYLYNYGLGVTQGCSKALTWNLKAADQGNAVTQYNVGIIYRYDRGGYRDYTKTMGWFLKAVGQGNVVHTTSLATFVITVKVCPRDYSQAFNWYNKAADQGDAVGQLRVGYLYDLGLEIIKNYSKAMEWSIARLPTKEIQSLKIISNFSTATWFFKAANQGYAIVQCGVGHLFEHGYGVPQNFTQTLK